MIVNIAVTEFLFLALFIANIIASAPDVEWGTLLLIGGARQSRVSGRLLPRVEDALDGDRSHPHERVGHLIALIGEPGTMPLLGGS
jgi:hypothetical protein